MQLNDSAKAALLAAAPAKPDTIAEFEWFEQWVTDNPPPEGRFDQLAWAEANEATARAVRAAGREPSYNVMHLPERLVWDRKKSAAHYDFLRDWPAIWAKRMMEKLK